MSNEEYIWRGPVEPSMFERVLTPITNMIGRGDDFAIYGASSSIVTLDNPGEYVTTRLGHVIPLWKVDSLTGGGRQSNVGSIHTFNGVFEQGKRYVMSVFGKEGGLAWLRFTLSAYGSLAVSRTFDLANHTEVGGIQGADVEDAGVVLGYDNDVSRYWMSWVHSDADVNGNFRIYVNESATSGTVDRDGTSYIYVGGLQIEQLDEGGPSDYVSTKRGGVSDSKTYAPYNDSFLWRGPVEQSEYDFYGTPENELIGVYGPNEEITASIVGSSIIGLDGSMPAVVLDSMDIIKTGVSNSKTVATVEPD